MQLTSGFDTQSSEWAYTAQQKYIPAGWTDTSAKALSVTYAPLPPKTLKTRLNLGLSAGMLVQGDSTGNEDREWFFTAASRLAADFPTHSLAYLSWNDTNQAYNLPRILQVGADGDRYFRTLNVGIPFLTTPDSVKLSITGDLDVRCKVLLDDWTPTTQSTLCGKAEGAGQRSWFLDILSNGRLSLATYADGTTAILHQSTVATPFADGAVGWVRATLDVDNGAAGHDVTFYTSTDGTTWTQLGAVVTTAGTTSLFDSTGAVYFPGRTGGGYNNGGAQFYAMHLLSGIGGTPVAILDLDALPQATLANVFTDWAGNVWTLNNTGSGNESRGGSPGLVAFNASQSGQVIGYSSNATRFAKQTPGDIHTAFVSYSHNEGSAITDYRSAYTGLTDQLVTKFPSVEIVPMIQNRRVPPADTIDYHELRMAQVVALANSKGWYAINWRDLWPQNDVSGTYVEAVDGVHPTTLAEGLISAATYAYLR